MLAKSLASRPLGVEAVENMLELGFWDAGAFILDNPPDPRQLYCFYGLYYCSQAMFQLGNAFWTLYRPRLHRFLLPNQSQSGAWIAPDNTSAAYGRNYTTAMAVLALTVEYRFLPIYQRGEEPGDDPDK